MTRRRNMAVSLLLLLTTSTMTAFAQNGSVWETKKSGWHLLDADQRKDVFKFAEDYKVYLRVARSALTSAAEVMRMARAAGFQDFHDASQVKPGSRLIFNKRDRAVILAIIGSEPLTAGSRVIGTHHDSPHIDLKARPLVTAGGFALFKTVYYGGIKKYQWSNLPLALIGRIDTKDGRRVDVSIGLAPGDPVFVIPDNAPHSDAELHSRTYTDILKGEELDPVAGSIPIRSHQL